MNSSFLKKTANVKIGYSSFNIRKNIKFKKANRKEGRKEDLMENIVDIQIGDGYDLQMTVEHTFPVDNEGDSYTVYEIRVDYKTPKSHNTWRIYKRFAAIYDFEKKLEPICLMPEDIMLKKKLLGKNMDPAFVKQRMQEIQACFNTITTDILARRSPLLKEFVNPHISPALSQMSSLHVVKEGYILIERKLATGINSLKLNKFISICTWKRRWCVITSDMPWLYIFNTREDFTLPAIALDLRTCAVEICPPKLSEDGTVMHCFAVSTLKDGSKSKIVTIRVETIDELTLWNTAISDLIFSKRPAPPHSFSASILSKESTFDTAPQIPPRANKSGVFTLKSQQSYSVSKTRCDNDPQSIPLRHGKSEATLCHHHKRKDQHMHTPPSKPLPMPQRPQRELPQRPPIRSPQQPSINLARKLPPLRSKSQGDMSLDQNDSPKSTTPEPFQVLDEDDEDEILSRQYKNDLQTQSKQSNQSIIISLDGVVQKDAPMEYSADTVTLSDGELLPGETVSLKIPNVYHVHINQSITPNTSVKPLATCIPGTLFVTNFKLTFKPIQSPSVKNAIPPKTFESCPCCTMGCGVPIAAIQQIDRFHGVSPAYGKFSCFIVRTKSFHDIRFNYISGSPSPSSLASLQDESEAVPQKNDCPFPDDLIEPLIFHNYILNIFAFSKKWVASFDPYMVHKFWNIYDQSREFTRLGLPGEKVLILYFYIQIFNYTHILYL